MAVFHRAASIVVLLIGLVINVVIAGNFRQKIFKANDGPCYYNQYRCGNDQCIDRYRLCNGVQDCRDNTDEQYCRTENACPGNRSFRCKSGHSSYDSFSSYESYDSDESYDSNKFKCISEKWKCDGYTDCDGNEDEAACEEDTKFVTLKTIIKAENLAYNWTYQLRNEDRPTRKWGSDVDRIAVALFLSNSTKLRVNKTMRDELAYELNLDLLSRLALKKIEDVSSTELASYINAFLVTCIDPRKFYVVNLVNELRKRIDTQNYTNPSAMLALCNAGERITPRDVQKLGAAFWKAHREFWTDTQALAVLALSCAAEQPYGALDIADLGNLTIELKKRQHRNGTVENLKTTALVMQALFATEREEDEDNFDEEKALKQILLSQMKDGSFGNLINTYYVLPVLAYKSLVNISSSHCPTPLVDEKEALEDLMNQVGVKWSVQFSLWIGTNRTVERTITLNVPANISFYRLMEFAAVVDNKYRFEYSVRNGKPHIYSISGVQDDPEKGMFWFLFTMETGTEKKPTPIAKSPADVVPSNNQHLVFWYKCGPWIK